jgi:hypothetical protein
MKKEKQLCVDRYAFDWFYRALVSAYINYISLIGPVEILCPKCAIFVLIKMVGAPNDDFFAHAVPLSAT